MKQIKYIIVLPDVVVPKFPKPPGWFKPVVPNRPVPVFKPPAPKLNAGAADEVVRPNVGLVAPNAVQIKYIIKMKFTQNKFTTNSQLIIHSVLSFNQHSITPLY